MPPHDSDATTAWLPPTGRPSRWPAILIGAGCCLLVLCLGLPPLAWLAYRSRPVPGPVSPAAPGELPVLTVSELRDNQQRFLGRRVRVRGKIFTAVNRPDLGTLYVYLGDTDRIECLCDPKDLRDFAGSGGETATLEGFVAERGLRHARRVFP